MYGMSDATLQVDRAHYAPSSPYEDRPQSIGFRATISAPHMHAQACESLLPFLKPGSKVLDVGSGSGYLTHVLAELVKGPGGAVVGIDHITELVEMAKENASKSEEGRNFFRTGGMKFVKGDGRQGYAESAPYDAIHVGAAAAEHHAAFVDQLKAPGRIFVPVEEEGEQHIYVIDKTADGEVVKQKQYRVRYVPLTGNNEDK